MAYSGKVYTATPDDLGSVLRSHMMERENQLLQILLWSAYAHYGMCKYLPSMHTLNK